MKTFFAVFFTFIVFDSFSQPIDFAPLGSKWWFSSTEFETGEGPITATVIGDSTIEGNLCSILTFTPSPNLIVGSDSLFLFNNDQKIYRYFQDYNNFYLIYDFSLNPGDSYYSHTLGLDNLLDSIYVQIIDTTTEIINSIPLKIQSINYVGPYMWGSEIYEVIGNTLMLIPVNGLVEEIEGPLRCYEDVNIGHYETGIVESCDIIKTTIELNAKEQSINIYPNPADNTLIINSGIQNILIKLEIIDINGITKVEYLASESVNNTLDISNLSTGIYIVKISFLNSIHFFTLFKK
jgi:hypothetical protein